MVPDGTGCVMLDAAYDAYENYRMIRNSDRRPVNDPRKDHAVIPDVLTEPRDLAVARAGS